MRKILSILCLAVMISGCATAPAVQPENGTLYLNTTVITGSGAVIENAALAVDAAGIIQWVGPADQSGEFGGYAKFDCGGRYLTPGLINAHVHLSSSGEPSGLSNEKILQLSLAFARTSMGRKVVMGMMEENLETALEAGVTTVRSLGDPYFYDVLMRDKLIEEGRGPRLLVSGPIICTTGGHGEYMGRAVDGPWEARKAVREHAREGVDWIKICATGGVTDAKRVGEAGQPQLTVEEMRAICDEAHRKNIMVAAHAESMIGVHEALLAGCDTIEHGSDISSEMVELYRHNPHAKRGYTALISTAAAGLELLRNIEESGLTEVQKVNNEIVDEQILLGLDAASKNGIHQAVGTDAGVTFVFHDEVWKELTFFKQHTDLTNAQIIRIATLGTAEAIGVEKETGSITPGKSADFLLLETNPLQDLQAFAEPEMVVLRGAVIVALD